MVGQAIGQLLPLAAGVAVSPMPIVAIVLILTTPRARTNGPAFLVGWLIGVMGAGVVCLALAGPANASDDGEPATWASWLLLALGMGVLVVAVRQWGKRPAADEEVELPGWMIALADLTPVRSIGAGIVLSALNPKTLLFIVAAAAELARLGLSAGDQAATWAVFTAIATIGVAVPIVLYFALGDRATAPLEDLKTWMARHNHAIMAVLCVLIAAKLIGDAIGGLSS